MKETLIIVSLLIFIILKQLRMTTVLAEIAANITKAQELAVSISADVTSLNAKISSLPVAPSAEEIAALKEQSAALVTSLTSVDVLTPDVVVVPTAG